MMHDSRAVANYFIRAADKDSRQLTAMQVIKLVYIAHGWSLGILDIPLIRDEVEAWDYGPVIRLVYDAFKRFGNQPITELAQEARFLGPQPLGHQPIDAHFDQRETELLERVWEVYGNLKAFQLSAITHDGPTPWRQTYEEHGRNAIIPNSMITEHFKHLAAQNAKHRPG